MTKLLSSIFGLDIFVERMTIASGPLMFSSEIHGLDREFWFLGFHVVVSPLQMLPQ